MHTASERQVSLVAFIVILIAILALSAIVKILPHVEPTTPVIQPTQDIQTIFQQETDAMRNQQLISEVGWASILSYENLNEYGIPQTWYRVQLINTPPDGIDFLQLNAFAPSALSENDLMIRSAEAHKWRKEAMIMEYTSHDRSFYFISRQQLAIAHPIDEG